MRGFDIKQIHMRSFRISGLTAKWGIGGRPSIWDSSLVAWWDARTFPDGELATIPNTATMARKAPDLTVTGATMASGTLQFDGVDDKANTNAFMFPERFTVFWDVDWSGTIHAHAGIVHPPSLTVYDCVDTEHLYAYLKDTSGATSIPDASVGLSTNGTVYAQDGSSTPFGGEVGARTGAAALRIAQRGSEFAQIGFRQLLIFNKELSQAEVNDVLSVMFPA